MTYFEIQKCDDYDNIVEIINADNEAKHFVRQRTYTPFSVDDDSSISKFEPRKHIRHSEGGFFKAMVAFFLSALVFGSISLYVGIKGAKPTDFIALYIIAGLMSALFVSFFVLHIKEHSFINCSDDLFILYDYVGAPCSVELRKNRARVLYKDTLYIVKRNKVKTSQRKEKLYRAYLNLYPMSVLDLGKYLEYSKEEREGSVVPSVKSAVNYVSDGSARLSIASYMSLGDHASWRSSTNKSLKFCKFLFIVDYNLKIKSIYSAASDEAIYDYSVLTFADAKEVGQSAMDALNRAANGNRTLQNLLKDILYL